MTNMWPKQSECPKFYGNPDPRGEGVPFRPWEDDSLTKITPPWRMVLAWAPEQEVKTIRIHKKCAPSLATILLAIKTHYGEQGVIEANRLHLYGGAYNFRLMRGSHHLSMHSYGCAIDLDPEHNKFGDSFGSMPPAVVKIFADEGWVWGGSWSNPDWMHFQAAII